MKAVRHRIGVEALFKRNTDRKPQGLPPEPGDLLIMFKGPQDHHVSLIFATYSPGQPHPKANQFGKPIPLFPGADKAKTQLNVLEYFSSDPLEYFSVGPSRQFGPPPLDVHFDYLNHRGEGKEKAELIYFATLNDPRFKDFQLRNYNQKVLQPWDKWTGAGFLPGCGPPHPDPDAFRSR